MNPKRLLEIEGILSQLLADLGLKPNLRSKNATQKYVAWRLFMGNTHIFVCGATCTYEIYLFHVEMFNGWKYFEAWINQNLLHAVFQQKHPPHCQFPFRDIFLVHPCCSQFTCIHFAHKSQHFEHNLFVLWIEPAFIKKCSVDCQSHVLGDRTYTQFSGKRKDFYSKNKKGMSKIV